MAVSGQDAATPGEVSVASVIRRRRAVRWRHDL